MDSAREVMLPVAAIEVIDTTVVPVEEVLAVKQPTISVAAEETQASVVPVAVRKVTVINKAPSAVATGPLTKVVPMLNQYLGPTYAHRPKKTIIKFPARSNSSRPHSRKGPLSGFCR